MSAAPLLKGSLILQQVGSSVTATPDSDPSLNLFIRQTLFKPMRDHFRGFRSSWLLVAQGWVRLSLTSISVESPVALHIHIRTFEAVIPFHYAARDGQYDPLSTSRMFLGFLLSRHCFDIPCRSRPVFWSYDKFGGSFRNRWRCSYNSDSPHAKTRFPVFKAYSVIQHFNLSSCVDAIVAPAKHLLLWLTELAVQHFWFWAWYSLGERSVSSPLSKHGGNLCDYMHIQQSILLRQDFRRVNCTAAQTLQVNYSIHTSR